MKVFEELNLSLFMPKTDLCDVCEAHKSKNFSEYEYNLHQTLKREARQEKENDKSNSDLTVNVYAMDLQCVLLSPKSTVSAMYYKTKLIVHNFTIYNLKTKEGFCSLWNESEGGLTANEFSTIISSLQIRRRSYIKALRYFPDCKIQYRLRHTDPWTILNQRLNKKISLCKFQTLPSLYTERRKIKKEKYDHLQILKAGLLKDYQKFYDELPHE
nr:unnamed protein product [Callosobruchus analis]